MGLNTYYQGQVDPSTYAAEADNKLTVLHLPWHNKAMFSQLQHNLGTIRRWLLLNLVHMLVLLLMHLLHMD